MPVKLLLADKSITIQKVVEMLFSGREYEVICVSDGEAALHEVERAVPSVVLADVDLPRVDGYALAARLKKTPALSQIPVILMMSRDDVYDNAKGKQGGIVDKIVKPFESQELIGKVKKVLASAPPRTETPASKPVSLPEKPEQRATQPLFTPSASKQTPTSIFDIISDAPTRADLKQTAASAEDESIFEVEPVVEEIAVPAPQEEQALPTGARAMEEIRAGLGLTEITDEAKPEIVTFESFDTTFEAAQPAASPLPQEHAPSLQPVQQPALSVDDVRKLAAEAATKQVADALRNIPPPPAQQPSLSVDDVRKLAAEAATKQVADALRNIPPPPAQQPSLSVDDVRKLAAEIAAKQMADALRNMPPPAQQPALPMDEMRKLVAETATKLTMNALKDMPPPPIPKISDETIKRGIQEAVMTVARELARGVIEQVAWEVIPQLAEHLIKEEIERLKETP